MSSRCWVIGSAVLDTVYTVDRLPQPGESVLANKVEQFIGGKGVNQAVAAARCGAETHLIGALGGDSAGDQFYFHLSKENLNLQHLRRITKSNTGQAAISVAPDGKNQISVYPGANMELPIALINGAKISEEDFTLCQFEVPDDVIIATSKKGKFILNPAPYRKFPEEVVQNCFAITPNETEATSLTGISPNTDQSLHACAASLLKMGSKNVIITLGERGAFFTNGLDTNYFPAPVVRAVDSTAAGDVFNGALIARLSLGDTFEHAIPYAIAAASLSVTKPGAVSSIPQKQQIDNFLSV